MVKTSVAVAAMVIIAIIAFTAGFYLYPVVTPSAPSAPEKTIWDTIKEKGRIVVGTSPDWPPFEFIDETGKLTGFEVELMEMIASRLGITVEWKTMSFDAIIAAVKNREIDLGVSGFSITPERLEEVLFTIPHTVTEVQLIMTKERAQELGIDRLTSLEDIAKYNLVVGTGSGTTQEDELLDLAKKGVISSASVKSYDTFDLALEDMLRGVIDAVYAETPVTTWWTMTVGKELVVVYSRSYWPVAFVAHKDAHKLVAKINGVLAELIADGTVDKLREKWSKPAS